MGSNKKSYQILKQIAKAIDTTIAAKIWQNSIKIG